MMDDSFNLIYEFDLSNVLDKLVMPSDTGRIILITGCPGSGKSVFLHQLYETLNKNVQCLTAVSAELLAPDESPDQYYKLFLDSPKIDEPKIFIIDSLDVLAYSRRKELHKWLSCMDKLKKLEGVTVICASRSFEANHLYPMNQQNWSEKINIPLLPDSFVNEVFKTLSYDYNLISSQFRKFLQVPLHLNITAEIIKKGGNPRNVCSLQGLYAKLFEILTISMEEMGLLTSIAQGMVDNRSIYLPYSLINTQLIETVEKIERSGLPAIVKIDSVNQKISFSHQTLIDYLMAWKVINEGKTLLNFLMEHNQSLFIRPTLKHILGFLRMTSEKRLFSELNVLFFDNIVKKEIGFKDEKNGIQMHIKTAILADISSWDKPSEEETTFLLRIFKESVDSQTLILQFFNSQPNVDWFSALKDKYFLPILREKSDSDIEYRVILSFLGKMASFFPAEILDIAEILMEKQSNSNIEWFFRYVADEFDKMDVTSFQDRYVDFLEDVIRKKFTSWYYEIRTSCKQISKYSPKKGIELYIDFVKKELNADESKINSSQGSLTESYDEVVPVAYQQDPYYVLSSLTDFFEDILDKRYLGEK
ncbi:hypothetical protein MNBD_UNCLBAC01-1591, partial [hydrothermal vent metagenome]